ncbi:MAG: 50S ribosomal protein L24 [Candidatus Zixiibacteriota bacterium]|nr:MAG: 50S ribosomal protein L24 [candidate division Zixibacteria bacterium]
MKLKKGDTVKVISGNDRGKVGKILKVFPETNRIIIEGVNLIKRHTRPTQKNRKGGIIEKEGPVNSSNVIYFDSRSNTVARLGHRILMDGKKVRINKKTGEIIE